MNHFLQEQRKSTLDWPINNKTNNFEMNANDYYSLPKLRLIVTEEICKILKETRVLKTENISANNRWHYHNGRRSLPIKYLFNNKNALEKIMKLDPHFITHGGINVKLPAEITGDMAYLCGLICGDGNLIITKKRDYRVSIHNKENVLLNKAIEILEETFGYAAKIKQGHGCFTVEARSEVIHSFFNKILEIETGRKENIKLPSKIKENRNLVRNFIAGFFDAEGCVALKKNKITCQITFAQKQKRILEEIQEELEKEGMPTKFIQQKTGVWTLYGNRETLAPFLEKIPFIHPKKKAKLKTAVENQAIWYNRKFASDAAKSPEACFLFSRT